MKANSTILRERTVIQRDWTTLETAERIRSLPIWSGRIELKQLFGGLQNRTYMIADTNGRQYIARSGFDQGRIVQTSVVACTIAAARLGVGPPVRYSEPHLMITDFIEGPQLQQQHQRDRGTLARIVKVFKTVHGGSDALPTSVTYWAPFATVRRYLSDLETGFPELGIHAPAGWARSAPFYREVTDRLERAIEPCIPVLTHNDVGFVNMMFKTSAMEEIWLIDWDGGGYGNPMWDIGELAMWAEADEQLDVFLLTQYWGAVSDRRMKELLHQHKAFKIMGALRLMTECAQAAIDPAYYLSPEEVSHSMDANFAGQHRELAGLVDLLRPRFDRLWGLHGKSYR